MKLFSTSRLNVFPFILPLIVLRVPGFFYIMALSVVASMYNAKLKLKFSAVEWICLLLFTTFLVSSFVSSVFSINASVFYLPYSLVSSLIFFLLGIYLFSNENKCFLMNKIEQFLFYSFLAVFMISVAEILMDHNFASQLYPGLDNVQYMVTDRFYVSAIFPNINTYSFVMGYFTILLMFRMFGNFGIYKKAVNLILFLSVSSVCINMGSRAYLLTFLFSLFFVLSYRYKIFKHIVIVMFPLLLLLPVVFKDALLEYFSDNSSSERVAIILMYFNAIGKDLFNFFFGFSNYQEYILYMDGFCEQCLHDPHNIVVEIILMYGFFSVLMFLIFYSFVLYFWSYLFRFSDRVDSCFLTLFLVTPIIGLAPSSSLNYYYLQLFSVLSAVSVSCILKRRAMLLTSK